jgi:hypothetical protein
MPRKGEPTIRLLCAVVFVSVFWGPAPSFASAPTEKANHGSINSFADARGMSAVPLLFLTNYEQNADIRPHSVSAANDLRPH